MSLHCANNVFFHRRDQCVTVNSVIVLSYNLIVRSCPLFIPLIRNMAAI